MKNFLSWLIKYISKVLVLIILVPLAIGFFLKDKSNTATSGNKNKRVAVVELFGPILDTKNIVNALHKNAADKKIDGIVLRIDSPGGAVAPSQDVFEAVNKLKATKPIVVSMGSVAASGGLYASLGASKIYAQAGTQTGSIGVILQVPNFTKIAEKYDLTFHTIKSGKLKDVGNPTREMTPEDKAFLQQTVNVISEQFISDVATGRNLEVSEVKKFADGRLILGSQAKELGLIDEIGDLYDASRAIYDILEKPLAEGTYPELVYTDDSISKLKKILSAGFEIPLKLISSDYYLNRKPEILLF